MLPCLSTRLLTVDNKSDMEKTLADSSEMANLSSWPLRYSYVALSKKVEIPHIIGPHKQYSVSALEFSLPTHRPQPCQSNFSNL